MGAVRGVQGGELVPLNFQTNKNNKIKKKLNVLYS